MQVHSPDVPFIQAIDTKLVPGSKIVIVGWPNEKCQQFAVNLKFGSGDKDEIALHMSNWFKPARKTNQIVRNTLTSAGWGTEETDMPFFPYLVKQTFKIEILCEKARFRVSIDDKPFCVYTHRVPLAYITHLEVRGDLTLSYIEIPRLEFIGVPKYGPGSGAGFNMNNLSKNLEDEDEN